MTKGATFSITAARSVFAHVVGVVDALRAHENLSSDQVVWNLLRTVGAQDQLAGEHALMRACAESLVGTGR
jgi:hypothetical protein